MNDFGLQIFAFLVSLAGIHELSALLNSLDGLDQFVKDVLSVIGIISCIYGLLQCFFGYRLFKLWCGVVGILVGVSVGMTIASWGVFSSSTTAHLIGIVIVIVLGIAGALIAYRAFMVGLFIYVFSAAFLLGFLLTAVITNSILIGLAVGFIAGLILGVVAVIHHRFWIILATSVAGGISIYTGLMMAAQTTHLGWALLIPVIMAVAGFFIQNATVKKGGKHHPQYKAPAAYAPYPPQPHAHPAPPQQQQVYPSTPSATSPTTPPVPPQQAYQTQPQAYPPAPQTPMHPPPPQADTPQTRDHEFYTD